MHSFPKRYKSLFIFLYWTFSGIVTHLLRANVWVCVCVCVWGGGGGGGGGWKGEGEGGMGKKAPAIAKRHVPMADDRTVTRIISQSERRRSNWNLGATKSKWWLNLKHKNERHFFSFCNCRFFVSFGLSFVVVFFSPFQIKMQTILTLHIKVCTSIDSISDPILCRTPVFSRLIPVGFKAQFLSCTHSLPILGPCYRRSWVTCSSAMQCCNGTFSDRLLSWDGS